MAHQSIANMAPVSMFIDGISIWLAYFIWTICPTAGGQESSTRYIKLDASGLVDPAEAGVPERLHQQWTYDMAAAFEAYGDALNAWEAVATEFPTVLRIPQTLLSAQNDKAKRTVARLKRNYAFDRARYFLPSAALTNVMIVMSARGWIQLCQHLLSHMLPEANQLGAAIRDELRLCVPRLINHAELKESISLGIQHEFKLLVAIAARDVPPCLQPTSTITEAPCTAALDIAAPNNNVVCDLAADLDFHHNRYAWIGEFIRRISVRFSWSAVAFAEIRDLNRDIETGNKSLSPIGAAGVLLRDGPATAPDWGAIYAGRSGVAARECVGRSITSRAHDYLLECDPSYVYSTLLGSQYPFEHLITGDKFIYEAELARVSACAISLDARSTSTTRYRCGTISSQPPCGTRYWEGTAEARDSIPSPNQFARFELNTMEPLSFLILSDIHFGSMSEHVSLAPTSQPPSRSVTNAKDILVSLIDTLTGKNLECILVSGDLTSRAAPSEFLGCVDAVNRIARSLGVSDDSVYYTFGNHDTNWRISDLAKADSSNH